MAHPYSTRGRLRLAVTRERLTELVDWNGDGVEDVVGTIADVDDCLRRAANLIDRKLAQVYVVPFSGTVADDPDTSTVSGVVSDLCDLVAARLLYQRLDPGCPEATSKLAEETETVKALRSNDEEIPGATRVAASDGAYPMAYSASRPRLAGRSETDDGSNYAANPTRLDHI